MRATPRCLEAVQLVLRALAGGEAAGPGEGVRAAQLVGEPEVEARGGEAGAADDVDEVVVREVHRRPVEHGGVRPRVRAQPGEEVRPREGLDGRHARVQRGEGAEDDGRAGEGGLVAAAAEEVVDAHEPAGGAAHGVRRGGEAVDELVPRRRAGERDLDEDADEVHVPEGGRPEVKRLLGAEEPDEGGDDEGEGEVQDAVRQPGDDVEDGVCVAGEDVGDVGAVEHGLERREEGDRDGRAVGDGDEARAEEGHHPRQDGDGGEEELGGERDEEDGCAEEGEDKLQRPCNRPEVDPDGGEGGVEDIDGVAEGELVPLQPVECISRVERLVCALEARDERIEHFLERSTWRGAG